MTELPKVKQGVVVAFSSKGQFREIATSIDPAVLNAEDGVDKLLEEQDNSFKKAKHNLAYEAYKKFENYKRREEAMLALNAEFEKRSKDLSVHGMMLFEDI